MLIKLHSQTTKTPKVRAAIQANDEPALALAERRGATEQTVCKWCKRNSVEDRSHTPHRLQTTLTPTQEAVALRKTLLVSLDGLLAVVREFFNPNVSRSARDRCLRRHGVGNLFGSQAKAARPTHRGFKACEPSYIHIDVKYLTHPLGTLLCNALPGSGWPTRCRGASPSWPSTPRQDGFSSVYSRERLRRMLGASCEIWNVLARSGSARFAQITSYVGKIWPLSQKVMGHLVSRKPCIRCPDGFCRQEMISSIANTGHAPGGPHRP